MRTIETTIYLYRELSEKAKEKARDWLSSYWDENDNRMVEEPMREKLEAAGYPTSTIEFSLSYCQGDGVAFYTGKGDYGDLRRIWLRRISRSWSKDSRRKLYRVMTEVGVTFDDFRLEISRNSCGYHYSHYNTMDVVLSLDWGANFDDSEISPLIDELEKDILEDVRDMSKDLERSGYEEIEYMRSREYLEDAMEANDYEFYENGERI